MTGGVLSHEAPALTVLSSARFLNSAHVLLDARFLRCSLACSWRPSPSHCLLRRSRSFSHIRERESGTSSTSCSSLLVVLCSVASLYLLPAYFVVSSLVAACTSRPPPHPSLSSAGGSVPTAQRCSALVSSLLSTALAIASSHTRRARFLHTVYLCLISSICSYTLLQCCTLSTRSRIN